MATTADLLSMDPMVPRPMQITRRWTNTDDTFTIELDPGPAGFSFAPGQFNMLYAFGVGEVAISISGDPGDGSSLTHTVRAVGAVTSAIRSLEPGDPIGIRGPFGIGWPLEAALGHDVVIVAGGIGLAPLRPSIYHLLTHRKDYGQISIGLGFRTPADMLYPDQLHEWRGRFDTECEVTVDSADTRWHGQVGVVTKLIPRLPFEPETAIAMVCGPEIMMRFAVQALARRGLGPASIYLSMERNMKCAVGYCGHCQLGPSFVCTDGPVFRYDAVEPLVRIEEI